MQACWTRCVYLYLRRQQKANSEGNAAEPDKEISQKQNQRQTGSGVSVALEQQLSRLQDERDSLLKTGVFNTEDDMILELEKQIRAVIQSIDHSS